MTDEIEGKLIILGPEAEHTYEAISRVDAIAGYRVARRELEQITDTFFDSPERQLFAVGLALRVRRVNGRQVLTVKGESRVEDGVISRDELEVEWSPDGFDEVLEALSQAGVVIGDIEAARERHDAMDAFEALGFRASSTRENRRLALTLMRDSELVGEVAVDAVSLAAAGRVVRHYEVECESKGAGNADVVRAVLAELASRYDNLRPWNVSKLEMAEVLEHMAENGQLEAVMDGERLQAAAYDAIEAFLAG